MSMDWRKTEISLPNGQLVQLKVKVLHGVIHTSVNLITPGVGLRVLSATETATPEAK